MASNQSRCYSSSANNNVAPNKAYLDVFHADSTTVVKQMKITLSSEDGRKLLKTDHRCVPRTQDEGKYQEKVVLIPTQPCKTFGRKDLESEPSPLDHQLIPSTSSFSKPLRDTGVLDIEQYFCTDIRDIDVMQLLIGSN
ncbi:hypothetical protein CHS0354_030167 [Potamilus streckersoni]|uniref:Uncharacterized protein n=1 Tax=Potamilus streckersoni TaxID=2493646 RepID=A0AAE0W239_9BIVA|nr:hypothetical protein CHS0354_030167 [Potamilus streckersoni]